jgi:enamine deaminase RidA (YjgF/YER057c/UK114 family)
MAKQVFFPYPDNRPQGYSPVTRAGSSIYVSGQVGTDSTGALVGEGDVEAQTKQCFRNVEAALEAAGASMGDLMKITAFLVSADDYAAYAAVRNGLFPESGPASSTVVVKELVSPQFLIEIEAVAAVSSGA